MKKISDPHNQNHITRFIRHYNEANHEMFKCPNCNANFDVKNRKRDYERHGFEIFKKRGSIFFTSCLRLPGKSATSGSSF